MCSQHFHAEPTLPSERLEAEVPGDLEGLILQCLEKDPADRPQSAAELRARLRSCLVTRDWSHDDAHAWWNEQGAELRDRRRQQIVTATEGTIEIDLARRKAKAATGARG